MNEYGTNSIRFKQQLNKQIDAMIDETKKTLMSWDKKSSILDSLDKAKKTIST